MQVRRASSPLRTELFPPLHREVTRSFSIAYTGTAPDPRIDAAALDEFDAADGYFGCSFHYVVKLDGVIEIGRDPRTRTSRTRNHFAKTEAIHIGVVGGYDQKTGRRMASTTVEQENSVEELMQAIADALRVPLEVHDSRENWTRREERDAMIAEAEQVEEERMDRRDAIPQAAFGIC